jgi:hypothetical protein
MFLSLPFACKQSNQFWIRIKQHSTIFVVHESKSRTCAGSEEANTISVASIDFQPCSRNSSNQRPSGQYYQSWRSSPKGKQFFFAREREWG